MATIQGVASIRINTVITAVMIHFVTVDMYVQQACLVLVINGGSSLNKHFTHSNVSMTGCCNQRRFTYFSILHNKNKYQG